MNHWSTNYIGLPYLEGGRERGGVDCWGLLRLVYLETEQIELPVLPGITKATVMAISREILDCIKEEWREVRDPQERDAVAMSVREVPHHVGVWTWADGGKVIHAWNGQSVVAETIRSIRRGGMRTIKFYRHGVYH